MTENFPGMHRTLDLILTWGKSVRGGRKERGSKEQIIFRFKFLEAI